MLFLDLAVGKPRRDRRRVPRRFRPLGGEALEDRALLTATARLVADLNTRPLGVPFHGALVSLEDSVFFARRDSLTDNGLWKSDGTASGTSLVKKLEVFLGPGDLVSGDVFIYIEGGPYPYLTEVNGTLYFGASDGVSGYELWKSDGTPDGTSLVKDIYSGSGRSTPQSLTNVGGTLYFVANDGEHGYTLWKSDGTAEGTLLVKDIDPPSVDPRLGELTNVNGTLFFAANDGISGVE